MVAIVDRVAVRYGQRPSALLGITDQMVAFDFDAAVSLAAERIQQKKPISLKGMIQERNIGRRSMHAIFERAHPARSDIDRGN